METRGMALSERKQEWSGEQQAVVVTSTCPRSRYGAEAKGTRHNLGLDAINQ